MLEAWYKTFSGTDHRRLSMQGVAEAHRVGDPLLDHEDPAFVPQHRRHLSNLVVGLISRFVHGEIAIADIMPILERTVVRLTAPVSAQGLLPVGTGPRVRSAIECGESFMESGADLVGVVLAPAPTSPFRRERGTGRDRRDRAQSDPLPTSRSQDSVRYPRWFRGSRGTEALANANTGDVWLFGVAPVQTERFGSSRTRRSTT